MGNAEPANRNVRQRIARLPNLSRQELLMLWKKAYGREAPIAIRREFLISFLAYRIQERAFGGLDRSTRAKLGRISRDVGKGKDLSNLMAPSQINPGTRIVRIWHGKRHEVLVTETGFEYSAMNFHSLSQIARKITGTQWSGPAFFGLRKARRARGDQGE